MDAGASWFCWIDPITYAFRALIPPHFYCEGGLAAGCPTVSVLQSSVEVILDRYSYIADKYEVYYDSRWANLGYLAIFIAVFQTLNILATRFVRHINR